MSTATSTQPPSIIGALRYEWNSARTLRSNWLLLGMLPVGQLAYTAFNLRPGHSAGGEFNSGLQVMTLLTVLFATAIGVMSFGHDFRHRTIVPMALTLRSRTAIVAAKAIVVAALSGATSLLCVGIAYAGTLIARGDVPSDALFTTGATVLYVMLGGLIGVAAAGLLRSAVAALAITIIWQLILENFAVGIFHLDPAYMPFIAMRQVTQDAPGTSVTLALPLIIITLAGLVGAAVTTARRDV